MLSKVISCILLTSFLHVINGVEFQFVNKLPQEIWVGCLGNKGKEPLNGGGWKLASGQRISVSAPDNWAGNFWGRTGCNSNTQHCLTGDCGNKLKCNGAGGVPPITLAEITLKGYEGLDYYDISLVDGFNVEMSMQPIGGQGDGSKYSCQKTQCVYNILKDCPSELQVKDGSGHVIACKSACNRYNNDVYCCRGAHSTSETCKSSSWPVNYAKYFKDRCPDAYSYAYDDHKSTFTCKAKTYLVTFGA